MPAICDQCGKPSYVMYVKLNPGIICDECEDADRKRKGVHDIWGAIKNTNRRWHYHLISFQSQYNFGSTYCGGCGIFTTMDSRQGWSITDA